MTVLRLYRRCSHLFHPVCIRPRSSNSRLGLWCGFYSGCCESMPGLSPPLFFPFPLSRFSLFPFPFSVFPFPLSVPSFSLPSDMSAKTVAVGGEKPGENASKAFRKGWAPHRATTPSSLALATYPSHAQLQPIFLILLIGLVDSCRCHALRPEPCFR